VDDAWNSAHYKGPLWVEIEKSAEPAKAQSKALLNELLSLQWNNKGYPWKPNTNSEWTGGSDSSADPSTCKNCGDILYRTQVKQRAVEALATRINCAVLAHKAVGNAASNFRVLWSVRVAQFNYSDAQRKYFDGIVDSYSGSDHVVEKVIGKPGVDSNLSLDGARCAALISDFSAPYTKGTAELEKIALSPRLGPDQRLVVIRAARPVDGKWFCASHAGFTMQECRGVMDQTFIVEAQGRIRLVGSEECLGPGASKGAYAFATNVFCDVPRDSSYQHWAVDINAEQGTVKAMGNAFRRGCLAGPSAVGAKLTFVVCDDNSATTKWELREVVSVLTNGRPDYASAQPISQFIDRKMHSYHATNKCMEAFASGSNRSPTLALMDCEGRGQTTSRWLTFDRRAQQLSLSGTDLCLQTAGQGAAIVVVKCDSKQAKQRWELPVGNGQLRNMADGLCADVQAWGKENGTPIVSWPCASQQQANQMWWSERSARGD
jgi:hypothetical protein